MPDELPTIELDLTTNKFVVHLPGPDAGHHVSFTPTPEGLAALYSMLHARATAEQQSIGTQASPTQEMVEEMLRRFDGDITRVGPKRRMSPWERKMEALIEEMDAEFGALDLEIEI